jgi:hypothetical protein
MHITYCLYQLDCFHIVANVNDIEISVGYRCLPVIQISFTLDMYLEMKLLNHRVVLFLICCMVFNNSCTNYHQWCALIRLHTFALYPYNGVHFFFHILTSTHFLSFW